MSLNTVPGKKYGLIIPNKKPSKEPIRIKHDENIFADESDDDEDAKFKQPKFDVKMETLKASLRKSTKINLEKALEEDASVFQYDEIYDEITRDKDEKDLEKRMPSGKKSKYVNKLLETSAVRKLGKELLAERKAQRELEAEKEKYKDKEAFVTGAYKEKMAELRELVEQRREEEAREEVMDVTKQDGLGGFYRYMFQQKTASKPVLPDVSKPRSKIAEKALTSGRSPSRTQDSLSPRHKHEDESHRHEHRRHSSPHRGRRHHNRSRSRDKDSHSRHRDGRRCGDDREKDRGGRNRKREGHRGPSEALLKRKEKKVEEEEEEKSTRAPAPPPGFIHAKPLKTTDEEVEAARQRFRERKAAGLTRPVVVLSDDEE